MSGQRTSDQRTSSQRTAPRPQQQRRNRHANNDGLIPVLARKVREVEAKAADGKKLGPTNRTKFQVIAFLMREERARAKADPELSDASRAEQLKRLDGIATILAKTAARDTSLISLLESEAPPTATAQKIRRDWLLESGTELSPDDLIITVERPTAPDSVIPPELAEKQVVPASVKARQLSNPFLAPDFSRAATAAPAPRRRLDSWELLGPLFKSFEYGAGGQAASMELPPAPLIDRYSPPGLELMHHQSRFIESVRQGHRRFLLADEPGLGKTAQSVLAASVANAYPLLAVVPNVVKMNWAREVERWTPHRRATVIHGDGEGLDAFADVVIVNYEVLDRHLSWLRTLGFQGMVVDEAHFIKNLHSQRSRLVLGLAEAIRDKAADPLLIALTGTPLINDIDDFKAIWQFLGWIDGNKPTAELMESLGRPGSPPPTSGSTPRRASRSSTSASCAGASSTSPPTCRAAGSSTFRSSSTTTSAARSSRRRRSSRHGWSPASTVPPPPVVPIRSTATTKPTASTSSASWPSRSSRSRSRPRPATMSSPWSARSVRRRPGWPPTTPRSWRARSARWCSSRSTST
jgi:hypothetical protein